jgi:hypothetical protein
MKNTPMRPPMIVTMMIVVMLRPKPRSISAGRTKMMPPARDSPIAARTETTLASRMLFLLKSPLKRPMARIAPGMPAEIVMPTLRPRYVFAAANRSAKRMPMMME